MRHIEEIVQYCEKNGLKVTHMSIDGIFAVNPKTKQTVVCSWGGGWEHVSINGSHTPSWEEMCKLKEIFWHDDETVVQYHPAKENYVNNLEHCLHLWKPLEQFVGKLPVPDSFLVGIKGIKLDEELKE